MASLWVSGLILPDSQPGQILEAVRDGSIEPVISWEQAEELVEVLARPRIRRYRVSGDDVASLLAALRPFLPTVDVDLEVRDPDDTHVIAAAVAGRADAIITGAALGGLESWLANRSIVLVRPSALLARLSHGG